MGTLRTLVIEFEAFWERSFPKQLLPHALVYSAWLMNRFQVHRRKATPYEVVQERPYRGVLDVRLASHGYEGW
jgi:hypothetical protein